MTAAARNVIMSMRSEDHELVVHGYHKLTGLEAIIAIHSTALGPALGGTRFYPYPDENLALSDVLRLSRGMTLKSAAAGLNLGGGKAVIIGEPQADKSRHLLHEYGRLINTLGGLYITAEDVGTTVEDMTVIAERSQWVTGLPVAEGGSGDPSPMTARGVVAAMKAVASHLWDDSSLAGRRVAIQGVGKVGSALALELSSTDVDLIVSDTNSEATERIRAKTGATVVHTTEILSSRCDILAPCALGGVLSQRIIPELRCAAIVGSANNQLSSREVAVRLNERGITYAPDFVANAGGIINISLEVEGGGYDPQEAQLRVSGIFDRMNTLLNEAASGGIMPLDSALRYAQKRVELAKSTAESTSTA